jgi:putative SOS response-associated peptidase YedK
LIPSWAKDEKIGYKTINARLETVDTVPAYRQAFRKSRCLIPANGFYEWRKVLGGKVP